VCCELRKLIKVYSNIKQTDQIRLDRQTDGQTDGQTDRQTDRRILLIATRGS
jgi:hypothetical protein